MNRLLYIIILLLYFSCYQENDEDLVGNYNSENLNKKSFVDFEMLWNDGVTKYSWIFILTTKLFDLAKQNGIAYQTEVMGGSTGTNSDVVSVTRDGVRTGLLSVPLRYMHTAAEVIALEDIENTARLMADYILSAGGEKDV